MRGHVWAGPGVEESGVAAVHVEAGRVEGAAAGAVRGQCVREGGEGSVFGSEIRRCVGGERRWAGVWVGDAGVANADFLTSSQRGVVEWVWEEGVFISVEEAAHAAEAGAACRMGIGAQVADGSWRSGRLNDVLLGDSDSVRGACRTHDSSAFSTFLC